MWDFPGGSVVKTKNKKQKNPENAVHKDLKGQKDPLEKETATHSIILAWEIPRMEKFSGLQSTGSQKSWKQLSN